jgi:hypothetical protein
MSYHAFVVMPYGTKDQIDFNRVYGDPSGRPLKPPALKFSARRGDARRRHSHGHVSGTPTC